MLGWLLSLVFQWPVVIGCVGAYLGYYFYSTWKIRRNLPPGPWPLPILGNMMSLRGPGMTQDKFVALAKKYGDPMSFWLGKSLTIILSSKETIRDVLITQQNNFCSRQDSVIMDILFEGSQDIAMAKYGPLWFVHRKLASRSLRNVVDASSLEEQVHQAVTLTEESLKKCQGPVSLHEYLANTVFNVICSFAYGKTYAVDDKEFLRLVYLNRAGNEGFVKIMALDFIPGMQFLPLKKVSSGVREVVNITLEMKDFISNQLKEHRRTYSHDVTRDFTDAMIKEQKALIAEGEKDAEKLTEDHLAWIVLDFYNAGTDTTTTTVTWFFLYMALYPEIQERCHREITQEIGTEAPKLADRKRMPFVEACIFETLRLRPAAPLGVPHVNITEANIGPYRVPPGTIAMPNLGHMQTDTGGEFGESAEEFAPEKHFLEEDGVSVKKPGAFLPFGGGKRVCLGEQLAKNDLFLIVTSLLQKFHFSKVEGETYSALPDPAADGLNYAKPYKLHVKPR